MKGNQAMNGINNNVCIFRFKMLPNDRYHLLKIIQFLSDIEISPKVEQIAFGDNKVYIYYE